VSTESSGVTSKYSTEDELYQKFGKGFVSAVHEGVQIAAGKEIGRPARELVDELRLYVEEECAREHK